MSSNIVTMIFVMLCFVLAKKAFDKKSKEFRGYGFLFSILGIALLAVAINEGLWNDLILFFVTMKNILVFLIIGMVHIRMIWIYALVFIGALIGMFIITLATIAKDADKKSNTIDGRKVAQKMKERDNR